MNEVKGNDVRCEKCGILLINSEGVSQVITHMCKFEPDCPSLDIIKKMGNL